VDGAVVHTRVPHAGAPVEEYLQRQGRFAHPFAPVRNEPVLAEIQARIDAYWRAVLPQ
jgi:pyruvate ferredoxin oxidoreductase beta subunit